MGVCVCVRESVLSRKRIEVKASSSCGCLRGCKLRQQQKLLSNWKIDRIHADGVQKKEKSEIE